MFIPYAKKCVDGRVDAQNIGLDCGSFFIGEEGSGRCAA